MEKLQILFSTLGDQYEEEGELQLGCAEELYTIPIPILLITITLGLLLLSSGSGSGLSLSRQQESLVMGPFGQFMLSENQMSVLRHQTFKLLLCMMFKGHHNQRHRITRSKCRLASYCCCCYQDRTSSASLSCVVALIPARHNCRHKMRVILID